ncbi:hypothetical protein QQ020_03790 [Fulvivirgaceae bacterium BMA12]|uniref:Uncharacterized protein n=1 Tax=Agaribacillus aureus TaxID=3051825 RepID=A0ABT8L2A1_9BACT|nr:hypothetical protein [Fulvivirgaceae bacterium BMA12]
MEPFIFAKIISLRHQVAFSSDRSLAPPLKLRRHADGKGLSDIRIVINHHSKHAGFISVNFTDSKKVNYRVLLKEVFVNNMCW